MALNVLIVDDSVTMRRMILRSLKMGGLDLGSVLQAGDGQDALNKLAGEKVDLALVDINMPIMNGLELLARLRAARDTKQLPVVVVSTEGSEVRLERIASLGASFVRKPFSPETLIDSVVNAISGAA